MYIAAFEKADLLGQGIRTLFGAIDSFVYMFLSLIVDLMFNIARFTVTQEFIREVISRMYLILAVVMLFKLAISLINGVVNPDSLTDKQAGMQKIIPRVLISLSMLIILPNLVFGRLVVWQEPIAEAIPKIILGTDGAINSDNGSEASIGHYIAYSTMTGFVTEGDLCDDNDGGPPASNSIFDVILDKCSSDKHYFKYNYTFLISTVVGIVMMVIMLMFCIDIAIRALKLCILEVLAPIPIISYIDPKSQKDGSFGNWTKAFISTYIDLFIKLATVYFMIFCIREIIVAVE